jgi:16S rRNA (uracil1498-N3)-methyltransferase
VRRFRIPDGWDGSSGILVTGKDARYLAKVLRLAPGDEFPGMDASGAAHMLKLVKISREGVELQAEAGTPKQGSPGGAPGEAGVPASRVLPSGPAITLYQCLPKGRKMDLIVRQAVEAGVARIVPLESRFSEVRNDADRDGNKLSRWTRIVREALQQSGSLVPTRIEHPRPIRTIDPIDGTDPAKLGIFFHQEPLETRSLHEYLTEDPRELGIVIGPEGGLSDEEIDFLTAAGYAPAYLGPSILRTETAALYAVASARIILLERASWTLKTKLGSPE